MSKVITKALNHKKLFDVVILVQNKIHSKKKHFQFLKEDSMQAGLCRMQYV